MLYIQGIKVMQELNQISKSNPNYPISFVIDGNFIDELQNNISKFEKVLSLIAELKISFYTTYQIHDELKAIPGNIRNINLEIFKKLNVNILTLQTFTVGMPVGQCAAGNAEIFKLNKVISNTLNIKIY